MERFIERGRLTKGHMSRPSVVHGEARPKKSRSSFKKSEKSEDAAEAAALAGEQKWLEEHVHKYHTAKKLGFIQCVGSRDFRFHKYCSSYCCMHSIKEAIIAKET